MLSLVTTTKNRVRALETPPFSPLLRSARLLFCTVLSRRWQVSIICLRTLDSQRWLRHSCRSDSHPVGDTKRQQNQASYQNKATTLVKAVLQHHSCALWISHCWVKLSSSASNPVTVCLEALVWPYVCSLQPTDKCHNAILSIVMINSYMQHIPGLNKWQTLHKCVGSLLMLKDRVSKSRQRLWLKQKTNSYFAGSGHISNTMTAV